MASEATIKTFLTLVRTGTFTAAAKELFLSQQAVSKQMGKLEAELDCVLFNRERGNLTLTDAGKIYYEAFVQVDEILTKAHNDAFILGDEDQRTLVIGVPEMLENRDKLRALTRVFRQQNPGVRVEFKSVPDWTMIEWLESGKLDVAVSFLNEVQGNEELVWFEMMKMNEVLLASADHPLAVEGATYRDFIGENVFYTPSPKTGAESIQGMMHEIGFPTDHLVASENFLSSCANVEQGGGVMIVLEGNRMVRDDSLISYPTDFEVSVVMTYHKDLKKKCARRFLDAARKEFILP